MRINPINYTSFQARIKISKDNKNQYALGATTATTGSASLYLGTDAIGLAPTDIAKEIYQSIDNPHYIETADGLAQINNEDSALSAGTIMLTSLPAGTTITPIGIYIMKDKDTSSEKNVPD